MERHKANPNEPIQCPDCNKTYPTRRYMLSHRRTIHLNKRRKKTAAEKRSEVHCKICDKKFQNTHNLRQHMMVSYQQFESYSMNNKIKFLFNRYITVIQMN